MLERLTPDLRLVARRLMRTPAATLLAVAAVAAASAASFAAMRVLDVLLLRPPAGVADAARVFRISHVSISAAGEQRREYFSYNELQALTTAASNLPPYGAYTDGDSVAVSLPVSAEQGLARVPASIVSSGFFAVVGAPPLAGRYFGRTGADEVVLSNALWQRLGGNAALPIGSDLRVDGRRHTIVGVAPEGFAGLSLEPIALWQALDALIAADPSSPLKTGFYFRLVARAPGASGAAALGDRFAPTLVGVPEDLGGGRPAQRDRLELVSLSSPNWSNAGTSIVLFVGWVSLLNVLVCCGNLATLLLLRCLTSLKDLAVQLALGCSPRRLMMQYVAEGVVILAVGTSLSIVGAVWLSSLVGPLLVRGRGVVPPLDGRDLALVLGLFAVTGALGLLVPALTLRRLARDPKANNPLLARVTTSTRWHRVLLVLQVALAFNLMSFGGLFSLSVRRTLDGASGIQARGLYFARLAPDTLPGSAIRAVTAEDLGIIMRRLASLPAVRHVAGASSLALSSSQMIVARVPGLREAVARGLRGPYVTSVTPDYFAATGVPLLEGRGFRPDDQPGSQHVAIVGATMARVLWPGASPLGQCILIGDPAECWVIVGIAGDAPVMSLRESPAVQYYLPATQIPLLMQRPYLLIRLADDSRATRALVKGMLVAPSLGGRVPEVRSVESLMDRSLRPLRLAGQIVSGLSLLAALLAGTGLYATSSYRVQQSAKEMAIRLSLGATPSHMARRIMKEALVVFGAGTLAGLSLALAGGRWLSPLLLGISPREPLPYVVAIAALGLASIASALGPANAARSPDLRGLLMSD